MANMFAVSEDMHVLYAEIKTYVLVFVRFEGESVSNDKRTVQKTAGGT